MRRAVRWARRLCFATSAACLVAAVLPSGAHAVAASEEGRPTVYVGYAAAAAIHQRADKEGGIAATAEPFYSSYPEALSIFGSDITSARASTYYPGATLPGLGGIGCGQIFAFPVICPPPAYPFTVTAPTGDGKPDGATPTSQQLPPDGSGPLVIDATFAKAHADRAFASADAANGGARQGVGAGTAASVLAFRKAVA